MPEPGLLLSSAAAAGPGGDRVGPSIRTGWNAPARSLGCGS